MASFRKDGRQVDDRRALGAGLRKQHGLQGPIDDAFMDSFVFVTPTGTPRCSGRREVGDAEQKHAITEWRRQFRGEAQVRDGHGRVPTPTSPSSNLVLWGDPGSNKVLARIADKLPVKWTAPRSCVGAETYAAGHARRRC